MISDAYPRVCLKIALVYFKGLHSTYSTRTHISATSLSPSDRLILRSLKVHISFSRQAETTGELPPSLPAPPSHSRYLQCKTQKGLKRRSDKWEGGGFM